MRGHVSSRERCPSCGQRGKFEAVQAGRAKALVCVCGKFAATKPEVVLWWDGSTRRLTHDQAGRRFDNVEHAERALGLIRSQIEQHAFYPQLWTSAKANQLLWENYLAEYLAREQTRCSKATFHKKKALARHLAWFDGRNIRELRAAHLEDFAANPGLQTLAAKTRADVLAELQHIFNEAARREEIERAPRVPAVHVPRKAIRWINPDQQLEVLEYLPAQHRPIFIFMMAFGCRVAEACALAWDQVDTAQGVFYLARTFSRRELVDNTKTGKDNALPITKWFGNYLSSIPKGVHKTPVFINPEADSRRNPSKFYLPDTLRTLWAQALKAAGLPHLPLKNGTRHSRGMAAINLQGWSMEALRRLFGHTSQAHTRKYAEAETELLRGLLDHDTGNGIVKELSRNLGSTNVQGARNRDS